MCGVATSVGSVTLSHGPGLYVRRLVRVFFLEGVDSIRPEENLNKTCAQVRLLFFFFFFFLFYFFLFFWAAIQDRQHCIAMEIQSLFHSSQPRFCDLQARNARTASSSAQFFTTRLTMRLQRRPCLLRGEEPTHPWQRYHKLCSLPRQVGTDDLAKPCTRNR